MDSKVFCKMRRVFQLYRTPVTDQTFRQRFVRAMLFWSSPDLLWDVLKYRPFTPPIEWSSVIFLLLIPAVGGSVVFAAVEHALCGLRRSSDGPADH